MVPNDRDVIYPVAYIAGDQVYDLGADMDDNFIFHAIMAQYRERLQQ